MGNSDDHSLTAMSEKTDTPPVFGTAAVISQRPSLTGRNVSGARFIVVMGVSGTGKSTLGAALSDALHLPFIDGDDLHPAANVAKMSRGEPLDDGDRQPWLDTIRKTAIARVLEQLGEEQRLGVIVACSSLKRTYRAVLRGEDVSLSLRTQPASEGPRSESTLDPFSLPTYFVYLKGDRDVLMARMQSRKGHFMKVGMLESQLDTLESPEDERGVVTVEVEMSTEEQVRKVVEMFGSRGVDGLMGSSSS